MKPATQSFSIVLLLSISLGVVAWRWSGETESAGEVPSPLLDRASGQSRADLSRESSVSAEQIRAACQQTARVLRQQLGSNCHVLATCPFVVAGDLDDAKLRRWHDETILPAAEAMWHSYFNARPRQPVTVLLFSSEETYRRFAQHLFGDEGVTIYGYYKPHLRTLVMNISTGGGTLVHELTHALMAFDFPDVPDWFNEGLASLHEQCRFRPDGTGIEGLVNWRLPVLQKAVRDDRLRGLKSLIGGNDFRGQNIGLNYAHARYFCLYMQRRGVLEEFYRRFREQSVEDSTGLRTALEVFPGRTWSELDEDFRRWVLSLSL